jgi:hypothetical protein
MLKLECEYRSRYLMALIVQKIYSITFILPSSTAEAHKFFVSKNHTMKTLYFWKFIHWMMVWVFPILAWSWRKGQKSKPSTRTQTFRFSVRDLLTYSVESNLLNMKNNCVRWAGGLSALSVQWKVMGDWWMELSPSCILAQGSTLLLLWTNT